MLPSSRCSIPHQTQTELLPTTTPNSSGRSSRRAHGRSGHRSTTEQRRRARSSNTTWRGATGAAVSRRWSHRIGARPPRGWVLGRDHPRQSRRIPNQLRTASLGIGTCDPRIRPTGPYHRRSARPGIVKHHALPAQTVPARSPAFPPNSCSKRVINSDAWNRSRVNNQDAPVGPRHDPVP
jgi:hypothetical protein